MRILHLAVEDHRRPGRGGGSMRNVEVNRRLADAGHEIEALVARYPGADQFRYGGFSYTHLGWGSGYRRSLMTYAASLPYVVAARVRANRPDLIVEDFMPPFSSFGVGYWTSTPTVGLVQNYFAASKAREYRLPPKPFALIERRTTRSHRHLIAISPDLMRELKRAAPMSKVHYVAPGLEHESIERVLVTQPRKRANQVAFLGRMDVGQKGLDLLASALAETHLPTVRLVMIVPAEGKDRAQVEATFRELAPRVETSFVTPSDAEGKWRVVAESQLLVMPSRYETFGMAGAEALACGTAVLAFDIPNLRNAVGGGGSVLVPAFDVAEYARQLERLLGDPDLCRDLGEKGRALRLRRGWDDVASEQEAVYEEAAAIRRK